MSLSPLGLDGVGAMLHYHLNCRTISNARATKAILLKDSRGTDCDPFEDLMER